MKCRTRLLLEERRKKGDGRIYRTIARRATKRMFETLLLEVKKADLLLRVGHDQGASEGRESWLGRENAKSWLETYGWVLDENVVICDGDIEVELDVVIEPYGTIHAALEVVYVCQQCKTYHPASTIGMPDSVKEVQAKLQEVLDGQ